MNHGRVVIATLGAFTVLVAFVGWRVVPAIEADLESSVVEALAGRGIQVASITAEGRTINVVGGPESPEERLILAAAARSVPGVRRVRSPLDVPAGASWRIDPVRMAQSERDPPTPPERRDPAPRSFEAADEEGSGSAGSGGGPGLPAVAVADPVSAASADGRASARRASEDTGARPVAPPAAASTPDPGRSRGAAPEKPAPRVTGEPLPTGCEARLTVLAEGRTLVFARGEAALAQQDRRALEEIAGVLGGCGEWTLTIVGYAGEDERSGAEAWELADRRAYAVARYLTSRGIDASRLATVAGSAAFDEVGEPRAELYVTGGL